MRLTVTTRGRTGRGQESSDVDASRRAERSDFADRTELTGGADFAGRRELSKRGRWIRVGVTIAILATLLYGSVWGQDDLFPFGPFRMYASAHQLNEPVADTRFELVDTTGRVVELTQYNTGIRRAEIEGQLSRFSKDPSLLRVIDEAYVAKNPHAPKAVTVRIVIRWYELRGGVETGAHHDQTVATWNPVSGT